MAVEAPSCVQNTRDSFLCLHIKGQKETLALPSPGPFLFEVPVAKCNKVHDKNLSLAPIDNGINSSCLRIVFSLLTYT